MNAKPDASDLTTFDVPDPPKPPGWKLRCLLAVAPGVALAVGVIVALRVPHLAWVVDHPVGYRYGGEYALTYVQDRALDWLKDECASDEQRRRVALGLESSVARGSFHEALAGCGDATQVDAMWDYARSLQSYHVDDELPKVVDSMQTLDRKRAAELLLAAYVDPGESVGGTSFQAAVQKACETKLSPEEVLPFALKVEDPVKQGRFHAALSTTKDPKHIDAVIAYAKDALPSEPSLPRPDAWGPIVKSLGAFGPGATPKLQAILESSDSHTVVSLVADAIRSSDLPFIVRRARALLDEYDAEVPALAQAEALVNAVDDEGRADVPAARVAAARERLAKASARTYMIFAVLQALEPIKDDREVDFCIVRGLSSFDQTIAQWSVQKIKERFSPDKLVDTLFSYMAQRTQFKVSEVEVYEGLLGELGAPGAKRVAENLERLVGEAKGDPEEVFWLYKKMGFKVLADSGTPDAIPVLRKYARDAGSYSLTTTTTDSSGNRRRTEQEKKYADEVRAAISAIQARAGGQ